MLHLDNLKRSPYNAPMFIRKTKTGSHANGNAYYSYRLVSNQRVDNRVKQTIELNLGANFDLPQPLWRDACQRLDELLNGHSQPLFPMHFDAQVEPAANRLYKRLIDRRGGPPYEPVLANDPTEVRPGARLADAKYHSIDPDSLELRQARSAGVEALGLWALHELQLPQLFQSAGFNRRQCASAMAVIVARLAGCGSERSAWHWLGESSALGELLDVDFDSMSSMSLYQATDGLLKHRAAIEQHVFGRVRELFDLPTTVTLYDLTNTYLEGNAEQMPKAKFGGSKEKRSDCRLLTLAVVLDGSGFIRRSQVFDGNVVEGTTLEAMLEALDAPPGAMVIMDRGLAEQDNLDWLREHGYQYLAVSRERQRCFEEIDGVTIRNAKQMQVQLQRLDDESGTETRLYCRSEERLHKELAMSEHFQQLYEDGLRKLNEGLSKPYTHKTLGSVERRLGRLAEKSKGISQHYRVEVIADGVGKKASHIQWQLQEVDGTRQTHPGVYCLRTNKMDWDEETMWRTYVLLTEVESVFRCLKSELGLRPVFHQKQHRADAHLFITTLAFQLVQMIRRRLKVGDCHHSWSRIRSIMQSVQRITVTFKRADGRTLHVRKATHVEMEQPAICQLLGIDTAFGGIRKKIC